MLQSTDDGIETDHWNDSEEDLFGSLKRGKWEYSTLNNKIENGNGGFDKEITT